MANSSTYFDATCEHGCTGSRKETCRLPSWQIWAKPMAGGAQAVLVVNVADSPSTSTIAVQLAELNMSGPAAVRDLWAHTDNGTVSAAFEVPAGLPAHGGAMVLLTPSSSTSSGSTAAAAHHLVAAL